MCGCSLGSSFELASRSCSILHEVRAFVQSYTRRMERSICDYSQIQTNCIAPFFLQSELLSHRRRSPFTRRRGYPQNAYVPLSRHSRAQVPSIKKLCDCSQSSSNMFWTIYVRFQICFGPYMLDFLGYS